jgi:hypothetical protein
MARSSSSQPQRRNTKKQTEKHVEEQAKVDALNWLVRQLDWEESLSALRGDAPSPKRRTRATKPAKKVA